MEHSTNDTTSGGAPHHNYNPGDTGFVLASTALVWLMIPGVGYFYSGMARSKSALSLIMLSCWSIAVVSVQWFLFGFSLTFSKTGSFFVGNFDHALLNDVYNEPNVVNNAIPDLAFCIYQGMFAAITPALAIGAAAERGRFLPTTIFIFLWTSCVYDVLAYWTWNQNGWGAKMGGLDFAGGTPVHVSSGAAALAYAVILGHRERAHEKEEFKPHNMSNVFLGTAFLWFGWFGFNGGSALQPNIQAVMACFVTNLSACVGGITWVLLDYRHEKKYSALGFCAGAVAGLVCITPACGYVGPGSSIAFGVCGAMACNLALNFKRFLPYDDALDVFAVHGVGGIVGNLLTGIFAQKSYAFDTIEGGFLDGHYMQIVHQLADTAAGLAWSFVVTFIILWIMNKIPGLSLRVDIEVERAGLDQAEHGISCYEHVEDVKGMSQSSQIQFGNIQFGMGSNNGNHQNAQYNYKSGVVSVGLHNTNAFQVEQSRL
ncbi:ammonium transporter 1 [Folsomia candida]|uniref:Ammonium transporter n=1 Tax=Folsomia candida TaxID=158441 RepID=A0A226E413_FOLCA|nr:ammonium transporter 1 [Folsomia candida]XP_035709814.1 ammonium transporter 1 [Folsomia candida]OXA52020.1 Ammonium transporter 1 [Folsomia candida]